MSKLPAYEISLALEVIEVVLDFSPIKSIKFDCVELKRVEMVCLIANEWYFPCFWSAGAVYYTLLRNAMYIQ